MADTDAGAGGGPSAALDAAINAHLSRLLSQRVPPKTVCPSEVARALSAAELAAGEVHGWRELMPTVRSAVQARRARGEVEVTQGGAVVPAHIGIDEIKGPLRVRRRPGQSPE